MPDGGVCEQSCGVCIIHNYNEKEVINCVINYAIIQSPEFFLLQNVAYKCWCYSELQIVSTSFPISVY